MIQDVTKSKRCESSNLKLTKERNYHVKDDDTFVTCLLCNFEDWICYKMNDVIDVYIEVVKEKVSLFDSLASSDDTEKGIGFMYCLTNVA